jgi:protein FrlC
MKLSFNSWVYAAFPAWLPLRSLEDTIDTLAEIGYDGIEIGAAAPHGFPDQMDAARRRAVSAHLQQRGLEVSALCPAMGGGPGYNPASPDAPEREAGLAYMKGCIELASDLSCPNLIFLGGYRRYGQLETEAFEYQRESLVALAEHAGRHGVRLQVEPTAADSNLLDTAGDCHRLIDAAGVDAGIMMDTFHIAYRNDDIRESLRQAGDRLGYVHLADLDRDAPGTHRDFTTVVAELRELGYDGWLSMEIGFNRRESDPDGLARAAYAHVHGILEPAGSAA